MVYISIDNDYHGSLALSLINRYKLTPDEVVFISTLAPRNNIIPGSQFKRKDVAGHPLCSGSGYKRPITYIRSVLHQWELARIFSFTEEDILVIFTEYQLNNALLAKAVKKMGARVYLFDEGAVFYFNNSPYHICRTTIKDRLFLALYNLAYIVLGVPAYARKGLERMYICIEDKYIDRIYSGLRVPIERQPEVCGYRNFFALGKAEKSKNKERAILFTSSFECFGLKEEELALSGEAVKWLVREFSEVYIKIHPADWVAKNDIFLFYLQLIDLYPNLRLVDNALTGTDAIKLYSPRVVAGSMSAVLFDSLVLGCQPVFLFHLLPEIPEFGVYKFILDGMGYRYINSLSDITQSYECGVDVADLLYDEECKTWQEY